MPELDDYLAVAEEVVAAGAAYLRDAVGRPQQIEYKGAVDLVTETDRAVETLIDERLRRAFPDHLVVGEEAWAAGPPTPAPAERWVWYLDPLDGTTNFAHGHPHFAVSLGLMHAGRQQVAVVADPLRDETFTAVRGGGARCNGAPIRVSATASLDAALLATGTPYDRRERADLYLGTIRDFMLRCQGIRRAGSAALDLCWVACGRVDGYWEWRLGPWDVAAGALVVREAGGAVSDFGGAAHDIFGVETLASNGRLHEAMLALLGPHR
ncbi:MAG TPA: inositol monophosphatase family protein [Candidatus Dormibacteraeota bacterium]|nr:inositol monophosphatase family protein [Candidatus Dormibacteraeota bacterium]